MDQSCFNQIVTDSWPINCTSLAFSGPRFLAELGVGNNHNNCLGFISFPPSLGLTSIGFDFVLFFSLLGLATMGLGFPVGNCYMWHDCVAKTNIYIYITF